MSLSALRIPWLRFAPQVREDATRLQARTPLPARILSLFAYDRRLTLDRPSAHLFLAFRRWWILGSLIALPFSKLEYVCYAYGDFPLDLAYVAPLRPSANMAVTVVNAIDWFNVAIKIRGSPQPVLLYRCLGGGGLVSEALAAAPWLRWVPLLLRLVTLEGDEEERSRDLATALARFLNIPLSSPLAQRVAAAMQAEFVPCPECGRPLQRHARACVCCGTRFPAGRGRYRQRLNGNRLTSVPVVLSPECACPRDWRRRPPKHRSAT